MIIKGNRRGGAKALANHLMRRDTNEDVVIREIENYPTMRLSEQDLRGALQLMETQARAKGILRTLYHAIIAPQQGEILVPERLKIAVDKLEANLGLTGHQRIVLEHLKQRRQHFHVVWNILNPATGKAIPLQRVRKKEWDTARQLEREFGLKPVISKGRSVRQWEYQRGQRSGIDPLQVRQQITAIYRASKTGAEFIAKLKEAQFVLSWGRHNCYVLVDKAGDIHGLLRRIEGTKLIDLKQKFPDLETVKLPVLAEVVKSLRPTPVPPKVNRFRRSGRLLLNRSSSPIKPAIMTMPHMHNGHMGVPRRAARQVAQEDTIRALQNSARRLVQRRKRQTEANEPLKLNHPVKPEGVAMAELIAWAMENGRFDILAMHGIFLLPEPD